MIPYTGGTAFRQQQATWANKLWRCLSSSGAAPGANKLLEEYTSLLASSRLLPDPSQQSAIKALALLQDYACMPPLPRRSPEPSDPSSTPNHAPAAAAPSRHASICGVYLHGPVGSGKTFLMDLFYKTLPLPAANTRLFEQATGSQQPGPEASMQQDRRGSDPKRQLAPADSAEHAPPASPSPQPKLQHPTTPVQQQKQQKQRLHFHEFMMSVHQRLHAMHQSRPKVLGCTRQGLPVFRYAEPEHDPLDQVVMEIAASTRVLCLDELHVTDVADAMILSRILEGIMCLGTLVIFTSNRPPKDLYKGGLSRKYFEPFIALTEETMAVVRVSGGRDYRAPLPAAPASGPAAADPTGAGETGSAQTDRQAGHEAGELSGRSTGMVLVGPGSSEALREAWLQETQGWLQSQPQVQAAYGRTLWIPALLQPPGQPGAQAAYLRFSQICGDEGLSAPSSSIRTVLAPSDYLHLCRQVSCIYIEGIPKFSPALRDEARRFVTLLDVVYEERCRLVCSADCPPGQLFLPLLAEAAQQDVNPNLGRSQKLDVQHILQHGAAEKPSASNQLERNKASSMPRLPRSLLQEEVLMYHRAGSRLQELCTSRPP